MGEIYDSIMAEEKATRSKCYVLQRDKVSNHSAVNVMFNETRANNEGMDAENQNLEIQLKDLKKLDEESLDLQDIEGQLRLKDVLKNDHANLESEKRTLQAQNLVLCKTMGEVQRTLDQEEYWWRKCDEIKAETNKDLQENLDQLEKKLSKEQQLQTLKNHLVKEEKEALIHANSHLKQEIREVRYSLQGESNLDIALDSEERKELKVQHDALKKDLTELRKIASRERSQQEKCTALRGETVNLRRDQEVLRGNIRDQENLPSCSQAETKSPGLRHTFSTGSETEKSPHG
ncbi:hypothetical protein JOQ06_020944 [Pogonophryne albipinna]|uniref:Uncharacterized protein n=1 Tax=Pogonophryne albipinna TaxID=1090488 RepID=A0AAD6FX42_9TELE|nr:hypothetical protein JOQ06_020944 [Pogonophryne albipinna]